MHYERKRGRWLLPAGAHAEARLLLAARALRAFGDGYVSLLLPYYLTLLGFSALEVGVIATATLLGSGLMTLGVGLIAHRYPGRDLLRLACLLMAATGVAVAFVTDFWPLVLVAVLGTINPSSGDVSVFVPLEHSLLARSVEDRSRTSLFARYSLIGALAGALGAQAAALPQFLGTLIGASAKEAIQAMFLLYALLGAASLALYHRLPPRFEALGQAPSVPLGRSRGIVYTLAALFSLDAFAGGFAVQSLLALWLYERFGLSPAAAGTIFFWTGVLTALSYPIAAQLAARIGLVNTMVFTHLPANVFCVLAALMPTLPLAVLFLLLRAALSSMDVPARTSYVMAVVTPEERPAAAGLTAVPRSLAAAVSPALSGYLLTLTSFGWPLVICGGIKLAYDLALLALFRKVKPPEER
ncbi:MAG TPA: MFS transporter [Burkholderiales bacterium]|nr:MFS transporter [Burkholderiales bacterium]